MTLPKYVVIIGLFLLFIAAVVIRTDSGADSGYLYFNGTSGTNYRYAYQISQRSTVSAIDQKAAWPEGVSVSHSRPLGSEYCIGYSYRLVKFFSEIEERDFVRLFTKIITSLLVFTLFAVTCTLWRCQAAALFAACLAAFSRPLLEATNGTELLHIQFAAVIISVHLLLILRMTNSLSWLLASLAAASSFAVLAVWE
ncbi:MAG: hypothetical protein ABIA59_10760, partial [Candidatus Latescibacterota bacterium]